MRIPNLVNISADSTYVLLHVHRSADSGSPRVTGSTSFSSAGHTSGCATSYGRFPGLRRTLTTSAGRAPARASSRPLRTVLIAMPVARATAATPPYPIAPASVPAHNRRARSSMVAFNRRHFSRTDFSASTANVDHVEPRPVDPPRSILERDSIDSPIRGPLLRRATWTPARIGHVASLQSEAAAENCLDMVRLLANAEQSARPNRYGISDAELDAMASDVTITDALWA